MSKFGVARIIGGSSAQANNDGPCLKQLMDDNTAIEERRINIGDINVVENSWLEDEASYRRRFRPLKFSELVGIVSLGGEWGEFTQPQRHWTRQNERVGVGR